jgi:Clp amino terminal domain, pathogenicity island component
VTMTRYDDRARLVFHFAREEAEGLGHAMMEPEHLLLGIMREGGETANVLASFGARLNEVRARVEAFVGRGDGLSPNEAVAITPRTRRVIDLAEYEVLTIGEKVVGVKHLLLGILQEGDGAAHRIIQQYTTIDNFRERLLATIDTCYESDVDSQEVVEIAGPIRIIRIMEARKTVYLGIKYHADLSNRPLIESISSVLEKSDYQTLCVARDGENWGMVILEPEELMQLSFSMIDASDVVLIELSEKGVGLGIEAGYAYAKGKPIITVARQGEDISATLRGISTSVHFYKTTEELTNLLVQRIAKR